MKPQRNSKKIREIIGNAIGGAVAILLLIALLRGVSEILTDIFYRN